MARAHRLGLKSSLVWPGRKNSKPDVKLCSWLKKDTCNTCSHEIVFFHLKNLCAPWRAKIGVIFVQQLIKTCLRRCDGITCFWGEEYECCMLEIRPSNAPPEEGWVVKYQKDPHFWGKILFCILQTIKIESATLTPLSGYFWQLDPSAHVVKPPDMLFVTRWICHLWSCCREFQQHIPWSKAHSVPFRQSNGVMTLDYYCAKYWHLLLCMRQNDMKIYYPFLLFSGVGSKIMEENIFWTVNNIFILLQLFISSRKFETVLIRICLMCFK